MNFIKMIFEGNTDEHVHKKFVRYSKGEFHKEPFEIKVGSKIQVRAGAEYLDAIFAYISQLVSDDVSVNGVIISKKDIKGELADLDIEPDKISGKKYTIKKDFSAEKFREFIEKFNEYSLLLNINSGDYSVSTKKSIPKPGKNVEGFVRAKFQGKDLEFLQKEFLFDFQGKFKHAIINHTYVIDNIKVDENLVKEDPVKARIEAVRCGKIIREMQIDGETSQTETELKA